MRQKSMESINEIKMQMCHMMSSKHDAYEVTSKECVKNNIEKLENKLFSCESKLKKHKHRCANRHDKTLMHSLQEKAMQSEKELE